MHIERISSPGFPVFLPEHLRQHLRLNHEDEDDRLAELEKVARQRLEKELQISMRTQDWCLHIPKMTIANKEGRVELAFGPIIDMTAIRHIGSTITEISLSDVEIASSPLTTHFKLPFSLIHSGALEIDVSAGFSDTIEEMPADLKHAALLLAAHYYETPISGDRNGQKDMPDEVGPLIHPYRRIVL